MLKPPRLALIGYYSKTVILVRQKNPKKTEGHIGTELRDLGHCNHLNLSQNT